MTAEEIRKYLGELNDELSEIDLKGEISLYGGAVMCLVYNARPATKDVDAIFRPASEMRKAISSVAQRNGLPDDWINDGVKDFLVRHPQRIYLDLSNLKIFVPEPDYLLAMKAMSARPETVDRDDVITLIRLLDIKKANEVFSILEKYYPSQQIKPATQYFIEELFER